MLRSIALILKRIAAIVGFLVIIVLVSAMTSIYFKNKDNYEVKNYKDYYNVVKEALYNYDSTLVVNVKDYDKNVYNLDVVKKVLEDNPELKGNSTGYSLKVYKLIFITKMELQFKHYESKEVLQSRENAVKNKIKNIVNEVIKPGMKDYEKEAALHDYIVNNCKYDERYYSGNMPKESYTAYGVLINGIGVCQGYALAMDRLLKASGIESIVVTGDSNNGKGYERHAWNIVKIGDQYYHLDTTWDDPVTKDGSNKISYSYFNLTDEQIQRNHKWDKNNYPKCNSTKYSFNNLNLVEKDSKGNAIVVTKDYDEFYAAVKKDLSNGSRNKTYKIINFDGSKESIENSIDKAYNNLSESGSYSYTYYSDEMLNCGYVAVNLQ